MLQLQDMMTRGTDLMGKPQGKNQLSRPGCSHAARPRAHTATSTCCSARHGSVPAQHEAGGGRSCVTVGGHFPAASGPQQR